MKKIIFAALIAALPVSAMAEKLNCTVLLTNEQTGTSGKHVFTLSGDYSMMGKDRMYHEESENGSVTSIVGPGGTVQITMMDSEKVIASGFGGCK